MQTEPAWLAFARTLKGVAEIPGEKNSPIIMGWIKTLGAKVLGMLVRDDETAWCGTFMAWCFNHAGIAPPPIAVRAKAWAAWGQPCAPGLGCLLVFGRTGGGHVGLYEAERPDAFLVLGGNQSNKVCSTWIAKDRLLAARWPSGLAVSGKPVTFAANGAALSLNEA